jgi:hypothetical protein
MIRIVKQAVEMVLLFAILVAYALMLVGCASEHETACLRYGFTAGTDPYANCLLQLDLHG